MRNRTGALPHRLVELARRSDNAFASKAKQPFFACSAYTRKGWEPRLRGLRRPATPTGIVA